MKLAGSVLGTMMFCLLFAHCAPQRTLTPQSQPIPFGVDQYGLILRPIKVTEGMIVADTIRDKEVSRVLVALNQGLVTKIRAVCIVQANPGYQLKKVDLSGPHSFNLQMALPSGRDTVISYSYPTRYGNHWPMEIADVLIIESAQDYEKRFAAVRPIIERGLDEILSGELSDEEIERLNRGKARELRTIALFPGSVVCVSDDHLLVVLRIHYEILDVARVMFLPKGFEVASKSFHPRGVMDFELLHPDGGYVYPSGVTDDGDNFGRTTRLIKLIVIVQGSQGKWARDFQ